MGAALERPQAPARHRLDVGAYYRMAEAGILSRSQRIELIDGDVFDMNPIGGRHAAVTRRLEQLFARAVADEIVLVSARNPLRLDAYDEPQPDFVALSRLVPTPILPPIPAQPTRSSPSKSRIARSTTTGRQYFPSTPGSACPKSGLLISRGAPSRSNGTRRAAAIPRSRG
jgi:Putative restriction endonuclease